jgi:ribokinase
MEKTLENIDFLAVGDIVTDAFIELKDAEVTCDIDKENCKLSVKFGQKIPYNNVTVVKAVGNAANAAVCAARLGISSALRAYVGNDQDGKECLETLVHEQVATTYMVTEDGQKTNYHYVLQYGAERTILIKHASFNYSWPKEMSTPKWIYFSSIAENSLPYHQEVAEYLEQNPEIKLAFQPGTFQIKMGSATLARIYKNTYIFFCNKEEAQQILSTPETHDIKTLLAGIHALGPKIVVISDGPNGAYTSDGNTVWSIPMYPDPVPPISRTGAGDAFSTTFVVALMLGKTIPEALAWGPINSMSVVQQIGAQKGLLSREKLEEYLKNAPEDYKVTVL